MKNLFLIVIAVLFALPVLAGECDYKIFKADINGDTLYRVISPSGNYVYMTEKFKYAKERRDLETASCQDLEDYKAQEKAYREALKNAKWQEVK